MERIDAIYARQSVDRADSISIESQVEYCKYETRGKPYCVFADKGYSGKDMQRPEFQRMLVKIRQGQIGRVICYKLDRCSRSILDFTNFMQQLQCNDTEFVSCTEKFDTSTPMGRAMLNICITFAQLERETIQQRVLDAYHSRCKRGFYMGGRVPFGYRLSPILLEGKQTSCYHIHPPEAKILQKIYELYAVEDHSLRDVVNNLEKEKILNPARKDGLWIRSHIGRLLRNPIYVCADQRIFHHYVKSGVSVHNNISDFIGTNGCYLYSDHNNQKLLVLAPHNGIIDTDTWLRCQKSLRSNPCISRNSVKNTWLAGLIKCCQCGYALVIKKSGNRRYFICSAANENHCSGIGCIQAQLIEHTIEDILVPRINLKIEELTLIPENDISSDLKQKSVSQAMWDALPINVKNKIAKCLIKRIEVDQQSIHLYWRL